MVHASSLGRFVTCIDDAQNAGPTLDGHAVRFARNAAGGCGLDQDAAWLDRDAAFYFLLVRPMDALSELLGALRLTSGLFLRAEFTAPWCIDSAPGPEDVAHLLPNAEHVSIYHLLTEGSCLARLPDSPETIEVHRGELIMFPHGHGHLLGSDLNRTPVPAAQLVRPTAIDAMFQIAHGGGGERTRFVCGFLACDKRLCRPLLQALPRMLHVPLSQGEQASWLTGLLERGALETQAPTAGTNAMLAKLSELLFIEAIRRHTESLPDDHTGWLAAVRDPLVGRALALLHADPAHSWTVEDLARRVGSSRTVIGERFVTLIGEAPMTYLTRWRLALASKELGSTREPIARLAQRFGYESEAAFNRAFKREFGLPPAAWRRMARPGH